MNEHVILVLVRGRKYSVLARRELIDDKPCFKCGGAAAGVQLVAVEICHKAVRVADDGVRRIVEEAMQEHPFAQPVCGAPHCYGVFLGNINSSDEQSPYQRLCVA